MGAGEIKVGCCGYPMAKAEYYAAFPVVEIQQTFYNLPRESTARRWREEAPARFILTMKAWQVITHEASSPTYRRLRKPLSQATRKAVGAFRPTEAVAEAWQKTSAVAEALGAEVVVFQCPPSFTPTDEHAANLRRFFSTVDRKTFLLAWEPRGEWPADLVRGLGEELELIHVVDPLKALPLAGRIRYFRLQGVTGYRYLHSEEDLEKVLVLCPRDRRILVLFNNMFMGEDARRFQVLAARRAGKVIELAEARPRVRRGRAP